MKITFLFPQSAADREVVATLMELASHHLLQPFAAVELDGSSDFVRGGTVTHSDNWADRLSKLGSIDLVRLVVVSVDGQPLGDSGRTLIEAVRQNLASHGIRAVTGSVIAPLVNTVVSGEAMSAFWNFNLIFVPEDGLGERRTQPQEMRDPQHRRVTAAAAVALVGALWTWLPDGPLDDVTFEGIGRVQQVRLARLATRVIDAGDLTAQTVSWAVEDGARLPPPPGCVRHGAAEQAIRQMVDAIAPANSPSPIGFSYRSLAPPIHSAPQRIGPLESIRFFLSEMLNELRPLPREMARRKIDAVKDAVERTVQERTFGADSDVAVSLRQPSSIELLLDEERRRSQLGQLTRVDSPAIVPSPSTWTMLASAVLAAADGADMPPELAGAQPAWSAQRAVISDISLLVDPMLAELEEPTFIIEPAELEAMGWEANAEVGIGFTEAGAAETLRRTLRRPATAIGTEAEEHSPGEKGAPLPPPDPGVLANLERRLTEWIAERERTLIWGLAARLADEEARALDDLAQTEAEFSRLMKEITEAEEGREGARRRFVRRGLVVIAGAFVLLLGAVVAGVIVSALMAVILGVVFLLWLGGGIFSVYRMTRDRVRLRHRLEEIELRPAYLIRRRQQAVNEYVRLSNLSVQLGDWARIFAVALHRPWGTASMAGIQPWVTDTGALSFTSGRPVVSQEHMTASALGVAQRIITRGWLSRAYAGRRTLWLQSYASMTSQLSTVAETPEADCSTDAEAVIDLPARANLGAVRVYTPREHFKRSYLLGEFADLYRSEQVEALRSSIDGTTPDLLIGSVHSDVEALDGRTAREFLAPLVDNPASHGFKNSTLLVGNLRVEGSVGQESWCGISPSLVARSAPEMHTVRVTEPTGRMVLAAFRLDLSTPVEFSRTVYGASTNADADADSPAPQESEGPVYG